MNSIATGVRALPGEETEFRNSFISSLSKIKYSDAQIRWVKKILQGKEELPQSDKSYTELYGFNLHKQKTFNFPDHDFGGDFVFSDKLIRDDYIRECGGCDSDLYPILKSYRNGKNKGVYFFYATWFWERYKDTFITPLYIGKTCHLLTRFTQHSHGEGNGFIYNIYDDSDSIPFPETDGPTIQYIVKEIDCPEERTAYEHKLIGEYTPKYNKQ
jgi:hypothetical protein